MSAQAPIEPKPPKRPRINRRAWAAGAMAAAGAIMATIGITGLITAQGPARPQYEQASVTSILEAAGKGQLAQVTINGLGPTTTYSLGTATIASNLSSGSIVNDLGRALDAGSRINFYLPAALQPDLAQALMKTQTPLWTEPGRTSAAGTTPRVSMPGAIGASNENTSEQEAKPTGAPEPLERPAWQTALLIFLIAGGILLMLRGIFVLMNELSSRNKQNATIVNSAPNTRFSDIAGASEAVEQMRELVDYLKNPQRYRDIGAKLPTGALLVGPPGTGKTLLARALAGEAGVAFHSATGSQFVEMYVGVGAKRIRELYSSARKSGKAIVFIDEIDAIARKRSEGNQANPNTESENTLIALLTELDGFSTDSNIVTIAATNRPDILDPALVRPGRLDRRIEVPLPDRRGRQEILHVHSKDIKLGDDVDLERAAKRTPGFSGAQLANVVNEAALEAIRRQRTTVDNSCVDAAIAQVAMGRARSSALVTEHDRKVTAWHEAGHTAAALLLTEADPPVAVSIVPRGPAGGVTWMSGSDEQFLTRAKAHARLVVALGGRAGEQMLLGGEYTQGAAGDLQSATDTALLMATRYGMTPLGLASREQHLGGTTTKDVTEVVEDLLAAAHHEATKLLTQHKGLVEAIAQELLDKEDLDSSDLAQIALQHGVQPAGTPTPMPQVHTPTTRQTRHQEDTYEPEPQHLRGHGKIRGSRNRGGRARAHGRKLHEAAAKLTVKLLPRRRVKHSTTT